MTTTIGAHLYIWDDRFLYTTAGMTSDSTQRHTLTLLLAMDAGGSFTLEEDDGRSARYSAALIGHGVARRLATPDSALLSLNFDPQSYEYHTLKAFLGRAPVRAVEARLDDALRNEMRAAGVGVLDGATLFRLTTRLAHAITGYRPIRLSMDMRVLHVAHKIKKELPLQSTVEELAREVGLSAHRLTHLFSDKLGLSIKSYVLWAKMRRAAVLIALGRSLADIAHEVGFADAAHLTRTFKAFFGLTPSFVAQHIRVHLH